MKRFGFSLDEDLHDALRARADQEGTSMAAICREALFYHLQQSDHDFLMPEFDTSGPDWAVLKGQVHQYLDEVEEQEIFEELDDFLGESFQDGRFRPEETPDAFFQVETGPTLRPQPIPMKFGPNGLVLHGFHHSGIERCERPFKRVPHRYDPDSDPWIRRVSSP